MNVANEAVRGASFFMAREIANTECPFGDHNL
jgi:hypothetical protein